MTAAKTTKERLAFAPVSLRPAAGEGETQRLCQSCIIGRAGKSRCGGIERIGGYLPKDAGMIRSQSGR